MYVILDIRLNIAYVVFFYSYFRAQLDKTYRLIIKRIFRYLKSTVNIKLVYCKKL
jgi:hypothetical protein